MKRLFSFTVTGLKLGAQVRGWRASATARDYNEFNFPMVRDGYFYAVPLIAAAILVGWLTNPAWAIIPVLLACFFLWFFRDPERAIPQEEGAVVSPGDGKVTDVAKVHVGDAELTRISIFLSVFNVHVNRSPITGVISDVRYQKGEFLNAMDKASAEHNEQNIVTVQSDDSQFVVFKQIAGLLARRIVFYPKVGDRLRRGQRVGLIKFGSRVDVLVDPAATVNVKIGDRVKGGASVLAHMQSRRALAGAGPAGQRQRAH